MNYPTWTDEQWAEAVERLTHYSLRKMARLFWRGVRYKKGGRPAGVPSPDDLAQGAICDVIAGAREWNRDRYPDFQRFLESVADSKVNHLVDAVENKLTRQQPETFDPTQRQHTSDSAHEMVILLDAQERFKEKILKALDGDDVARQVFECLDAGYTKPADISELLGVCVSDVNNAFKRYWRKVEPLIRRCLHDWR